MLSKIYQCRSFDWNEYILGVKKWRGGETGEPLTETFFPFHKVIAALRFTFKFYDGNCQLHSGFFNWNGNDSKWNVCAQQKPIYIYPKQEILLQIQISTFSANSLWSRNIIINVERISTSTFDKWMVIWSLIDLVHDTVWNKH